MFSLKPGKVLPVAAACAALSALVACGAGSYPIPRRPRPVRRRPRVRARRRRQPRHRRPHPRRTRRRSDRPGDPAPPKDIVLAPTYTEFQAIHATFSKPHWPAWSDTGTAVVDGVACASSAWCTTSTRCSRSTRMGSVWRCRIRSAAAMVAITRCIRTTAPGSCISRRMWPRSLRWGSSSRCGGSRWARRRGRPAGHADLLRDRQGKSHALHGRPGRHQLDAHREIVVVTGTSPTQVPRYDWNATGL